MNDTLTLVTDEKMLLHDAGPGHPERPARLRAIIEKLRSMENLDCLWTAPQPAPIASIVAIHDAAHVERLVRLRGLRGQLDADTAVGPGSIDAALLSAGAGIAAVDAVLDGDAVRAFALTRPPGHHAERDRSMGFCLFNNLAIAAEHAIGNRGIRRVLIIDWDVHHGNGTQHVFEDRSDVLVFNTHEFPLYPGTGALEETGRGDGAGFTVNVPLPAGMEDPDYLAVYERLLVPIAESYRPELVLVSAGFDAHQQDPLAGMLLTERAFSAMTGIVRNIADRHADGRLVLVLEGGYDLGALSDGVGAVCEVLAGGDPAVAEGSVSELGREAIARADEVHGTRWRLQ